ncbi:MAG: helix-turn-helix domain-containing protein [Pseudomonadota bacterium]
MTKRTMPKPDAHLQVYVDILGIDGAVKFLLEFGGAEMYFPANPKGNSELARVMGIEKARALCAASDRMKGRIPTGKPWLAKVMRAKGLSNAQIARKLHVIDNTVRRYLEGEPKRPDGPRQLSLF